MSVADKIRLGIVALNIPHAKARAAAHVTVSIGAATSLADKPMTKPQLIEFCMLAAQYDGLAATITTLQVPLDFKD